MSLLLERESEIASIDALLDAAISGTGGLLLIEGDAGIGKTGLVRAATTSAGGRGLQVLTARGAELERDLAFGTVRELLGGGERAEAGDGAAALAGPVLGRDPEGAGQAGRPELFSVLHGLYWLVADLAADRPVLLVVDDAHWCDEPSLRFLAYLARRLDGLPVGVLVASRPTAQPPQRALLDLLSAEPVAATVRPRPLGVAGVEMLVRAALGSPDTAFTAACRTASGGNPFLLTELLAALAAAGVTAGRDDVDRIAAVVPRGVQRAVLARLAALPEPAVELARAAAVLGDGTVARRAARLVGVREDEVGRLVDALVAARLIEPDVTLTFVHPLLRAAVASTLGPAALAAAHRRAAVLLAGEGEDGDVLVPHLLAAAATGHAWVVDALRGAARRAVGRGAPEVAARYLRRALDEPPPQQARYPLLMELGGALMLAGAAAALVHLTAAVDEAPDAECRARSSILLARALSHNGQVPEAVQVCERALAGLGVGHPELRLELEVELVTAASLHVSTREVAVRWHAERTGDPEPTSRSACMMLANLALEEVMNSRSRDRAVELAELSLTRGHLLEPESVFSLPSALISLTLSGRARRAVQVWDVAISGQRSRGDMRGYALSVAFRGYAAYHLGDLHAAVADTRSSLEVAEQAALLTMTEGFAAAWLVYALIDIGDHRTADAELSSRAALLGAGPSSSGSYLLSARGQLRLAQGRFDEAVADLDECGRRAADSGATGPVVFRWRPHLALALRGRGDREDAARVGREALRQARAWGAPLPLAESLRAAALTATDGSAEELLREAVETAVDAPVERARALTELGGLLRRTGYRTAAREPLRAGLDLALAHGAGSVARSAQEELVTAGARPRRMRTTGRDALTATELRVADMAAHGLTNREIAQALFVSGKTIETHLGSTYRKLGIASRTQLAGSLGGR